MMEVSSSDGEQASIVLKPLDTEWSMIGANMAALCAPRTGSELDGKWCMAWGQDQACCDSIL